MDQDPAPEPGTPPRLMAPDARESARRKREVVIALIGVLLIVVLTWVELKLLGVNSYLSSACST